MKAAVVDHAGGIPRYQDFPDPEVGEGQVLVTVEAVAVENVDRAIVAGTHYTAAQFQAALPAIPCFDGIGRLQDGTLVGFGGVTPPYGTLAQYAVVPSTHTAPRRRGSVPTSEVPASSSSPTDTSKEIP